MRRFALVAALCLSVAPGHAWGQKYDTDLKTYLDGVTERGRALYSYDQAAWHGTDAFLELKPDTNGLAYYICTKTPTGWLVSFPRWNNAYDKLLVPYEAIESEPGRNEARRYDPSKEIGDNLAAMERALELALADFPKPNRPYNTAILPAPNGNLYVYLYPGQTKTTIWPLGGDVRYTVSPDGKQTLEKRQLHKAHPRSRIQAKFRRRCGNVQPHLVRRPRRYRCALRPDSQGFFTRIRRHRQQSFCYQYRRHHQHYNEMNELLFSDSVLL